MFVILFLFFPDFFNRIKKTIEEIKKVEVNDESFSEVIGWFGRYATTCELLMNENNKVSKSSKVNLDKLNLICKALQEKLQRFKKNHKNSELDKFGKFLEKFSSLVFSFSESHSLLIAEYLTYINIGYLVFCCAFYHYQLDEFYLQLVKVENFEVKKTIADHFVELIEIVDRIEQVCLKEDSTEIKKIKELIVQAQEKKNVLNEKVKKLITSEEELVGGCYKKKDELIAEFDSIAKEFLESCPLSDEGSKGFQKKNKRAPKGINEGRTRKDSKGNITCLILADV